MHSATRSLEAPASQACDTKKAHRKADDNGAWPSDKGTAGGDTVWGPKQLSVSYRNNAGTVTGKKIEGLRKLTCRGSGCVALDD